MWGLCVAVWFDLFSFPSSVYRFPYTAQSPTLYTKVRFESVEDVYDEIGRIEKVENKWSLGRNLYFNLSLFCDPQIVVTDECWDLINEYQLVSEYNVPISDSLENAPWHKYKYFNLIKRENQEALKYYGEKQSN